MYNKTIDLQPQNTTIEFRHLEFRIAPLFVPHFLNVVLPLSVCWKKTRVGHPTKTETSRAHQQNGIIHNPITYTAFRMYILILRYTYTKNSAYRQRATNAQETASFVLGNNDDCFFLINTAERSEPCNTCNTQNGMGIIFLTNNYPWLFY